LASKVPALRISFEDFLTSPQAIVRKMTNYLGLRELKPPSRLPVTMATEIPKLRRWKKRESQLLQLGERKQVRAMMELLGYEMNPELWL
jgi:hypothetical protein